MQSGAYFIEEASVWSDRIIELRGVKGNRVPFSRGMHAGRIEGDPVQQLLPFHQISELVKIGRMRQSTTVSRCVMRVAAR